MTSTSLWRPLMETAISLTQGWTSMRFPCNLLNFLEHPQKSQRIPKYFATSIRPPDSHRWVWKHNKRNPPRDARPHSWWSSGDSIFLSCIFLNIMFSSFNVQCLCWDGFSSLSSFVLVTRVDFLKLIWLSFRFFSFWHWGSFKFAFFG